ncbi:MAG: extracellular solute-binding protein [Verrucomicrobiales bacterium]
MTSKDRLTLGAAAAALVLLGGCGGSSDSAQQFPPHDNSQQVEAYYKSLPDRFVFATPEDLPGDLRWENGLDLPDIGSPQAKKGGTLHGALSDFPRTLRWVGPDSNGAFRPYILDDMVMNYVHRHPNVDGWYPGVAKEWALEAETATVYIRIDPEARWSDGEPVTTEDTLFQFYFRASEDTNAPFGKHFYEEKYKRLTIYDDHTFAVTVAEKKPDYASYVFETTPQPRHFYREHGPDFVRRYQWRFVSTTAAYVIVDEDIKKGRSITLTRNDAWWAKDRKFWRNRFNPDRIELSVVRDPDKAFEAFKKGDFDMARLNLSKYWYEQLPDDDSLVRDGYVHKVTFYNDVPRGTVGLWLNLTKPPLDNVHVRRGLHHAANWQLVIDQFFRGDWARLNTTSDGYGELSRKDIRPREYSVELAQAEFAKAGFTERGPDGVLRNADGQRLSFTVTTGFKTFADAVTILKQEALKAGVEFNIEVLDSTAGWKKVQEKKHEIALTGTGSSPTEIYPRYWDFWHSDNGIEDGKPKAQTNNFSCTALPELDQMIDRYDRSESHQEKVELAHRMEDVLFDHAAWVPGVDMVFYRVGFWRWVKWPSDFNVKRSEIERSYWLHWIDQEARAETLEARKSAKTFASVIEVYDQYLPE